MIHVEYRIENGHRLAFLPAEQYETLLDLVEAAHDAEIVRRHMASPEPTIPAEVLYAIMDGEHPVRAWRKYRGMTLTALAAQAGIATPFLSQIESGKREMSVSTLRKLGWTLEADIEFLLPD